MREWLIREDRSGLWWRPGGNGYTSNVLEAGLWTEADAKRLQSGPNDWRRDIAVHVSKVEALIENVALFARTVTP